MRNNSITNIALDKFDQHQLKAYSATMLYGLLQYKAHFKKYPLHVGTMRVFLGGLVVINTTLFMLKAATLNNMTLEYTCDMVAKIYASKKHAIYADIISASNGIMHGSKKYLGKSNSTLDNISSKFIKSDIQEDNVLERECSLLLENRNFKNQNESINKNLDEIITSNKAALFTVGLPIATLFSMVVNDALEGNIKNIPTKMSAYVENGTENLIESLHEKPTKEEIELLDYKMIKN